MKHWFLVGCAVGLTCALGLEMAAAQVAPESARGQGIGTGGQRRAGLKRRPAPPRKSILPRPPAYAHWIVRREVVADYVKDPEERKRIQASLAPQSIEYIRSPKLGRIIVNWEPGLQTVIWQWRGIQLHKIGVHEEIVVKEYGQAEESKDALGGFDHLAEDIDVEYSVAFYPGFRWLREEMLLGPVNAFGLDCLFYASEARMAGPLTGVAGGAAAGETNGVPLGAVEPKLGPGDEGWLTANGKWPVAERDGAVVNIFQHLRAPDSVSFPRMPPEFQVELKKYCVKWGIPPPEL